MPMLKKKPGEKKSAQSVRTAMHEMKRGKLKSGGSGKKVTNPKQAIAIGLSEARRAGAKVPAKKDVHAKVGKAKLTEHKREHAAMKATDKMTKAQHRRKRNLGRS